MQRSLHLEFYSLAHAVLFFLHLTSEQTDDDDDEDHYETLCMYIHESSRITMRWIHLEFAVERLVSNFVSVQIVQFR